MTRDVYRGWRAGLLGTALAALVALGLGGCATPGERAVGAAERERAEAALAARQAQLAEWAVWGVRGRLAIRSAHEGWHANVQWQQDADHYLIDLVGPMGQGAVRLSGDPYRVVLDSGSEQRVAASPEALLEENTGWRLPVNGLRYWMRGLPQPGALGRFELDAQGRLLELEQDGWHIAFQRYTDVRGVAVPDRLALRHADLRVRVVVDTWTLGES
ncbi:outer membrane lipoprotein LolB [Ectothiorhodospiraceae bacterium 2226]|nr:outer membrane lipoprotein LolB [Ectothiorhodospiraceae bacterium 2226]